MNRAAIDTLKNKIPLRLLALCHDLGVVLLSWYGAFWLRFNLETIPLQFSQTLWESLPIVVAIQGILFWRIGLYRGIWRFASLPDLARILKATLIGTVLIFIALFFLNRLDAVPRSIPVLYTVLLLILIGAPRLTYRWFKDYHLKIQTGKRVLIIGAGHAAEMLVRDLLRRKNTSIAPVAFVDDQSSKIGSQIHGIEVVGNCDQILEIVASYNIDELIIALPSISSTKMRHILSACEQTKLPIRTLPKLRDIVDGKQKIVALHDISIEDLLGREPIELDWTTINNTIKGKTILITGAGGSIGSELCRQLARLKPRTLILVENHEFNLYSIEAMLEHDFPTIKVTSHLEDICDIIAMDKIFERDQPDMVFHAAAYKHVPMLEKQIRQAMRNNVIGTKIIAQLSSRYGVNEFILISTDKAVNPSNIMGTSKRIAELLIQNMNEDSPTRFVTVRFGNVLGSSGSVIPRFKEQIQRGGPVTVTDPEISRFFMTIPEACQLILQAATIGKGGEILVLDMGDSLKITELAKQMIRLSGKQPGTDIEIIYTGLRPGEKMHEELFHESETALGTSHSKVRIAQSRQTNPKEILKLVSDIEQACVSYDVAKLVHLAHQAVPETQVIFDEHYQKFSGPVEIPLPLPLPSTRQH